MTYTEKKTPQFGVNDEVYVLDTEIYDNPTWVHGVVTEVGDESLQVKWDDLEDPTDYEISDLPDIRHKLPDESPKTEQGIEAVYDELAIEAMDFYWRHIMEKLNFSHLGDIERKHCEYLRDALHKRIVSSK